MFFLFFFFNDVTLALLFQAFIVLDLATVQSLFVSPELMQLSVRSIFHSNISSCVPRPSQCGAISWLKYVSENIQSASLIILFFAAAVCFYSSPPTFFASRKESELRSQLLSLCLEWLCALAWLVWLSLHCCSFFTCGASVWIILCIGRAEVSGFPRIVSDAAKCKCV